VRALGETDLNPVSGLGKISQLLFAVLQPGNIVANLVAGESLQDVHTCMPLIIPAQVVWRRLALNSKRRILRPPEYILTSLTEPETSCKISRRAI
jgi:hypothetical protein